MEIYSWAVKVDVQQDRQLEAFWKLSVLVSVGLHSALNRSLLFILIPWSACNVRIIAYGNVGTT